MTVNLPATPEEAQEALHQITAKVVQAGASGRDDEARTWLARHEDLEKAACAKWPGQGFEPYEPDEDDLAWAAERAAAHRAANPAPDAP